MLRKLSVCLLAVTVSVGVYAQEKAKQASSFDDAAWVAANAVTREWTREEMLSAISDDIPGVSEVELARWAVEAASRDVYDVSGGPGSESGGLPELTREDRRRTIEPDDEPAPEVPPVAEPVRQRNGRFGVGTDFAADVRSLGYTYPAPYTRYETFPTYTDFPHITVGKVFFNKPGDTRRWVCSAASIGGDGVLTAGHCVRDGKTGAWWTNWVFAPAYRNGTSPYGQWSANHLWSRGPWVNGGNGDFRFDVGGAVLNRRSGIKISQTVGWLGFMWNQSLTDVSAHWALIGYPADSPFTGAYQYICQASYAYPGAFSSPNTLGAGCDMTGGASGGPWIRKYGKFATTADYSNGVNSYRRCSDTACTSKYVHELFSPYFDTNVKSLKDCIVNSIPGNPADPAKLCAPGT